jgi:hypothetical protein
MTRRTTAATAALATLALGAQSAQASVQSTRSATRVAKAIVDTPGQYVGARWVKLPPRGRPAAVASTKLLSFPRAGKTYGLLSTGRASAITLPNYTTSLSNNNGGSPYRGTRDTVILRVDINAPKTARCLSLSFRFLSDEYPEFVHSDFNDAFLAELDHSTWTALTGGPRIKAPRNFAKVKFNRNVSVNGAGDYAVRPSRAYGTTYDAGTRRLRASTPITPGRHSVFLSIFDQGDHQYDSTVMLDRLVASNRTPCVSGSSLY